MRFSDAVDGSWLTNKRNRAESTFASYSRIYCRLEAFVEDAELEEITSRRVNEYLTYLVDERGVQAQTVMNHWIALSAFWKWASGDLQIQNVIRQGVPRPVHHQILLFGLPVKEV